LIGANLQGVDMTRANVRAANLCAADLRDTILRGTDFGYAELLGANLRGATFDENTNFRNATISADDCWGVDLTLIKKQNLPESLWTAQQ
jgi:uncharacterized protein YjbI with pentapeptide repeats